MENIYIDSENSIINICRNNNIPFPTNNISKELKEILLKYTIIFENGFGNLNASYLIGIFRDLESKKILKKDNLLRTLLGNNITSLNNIEFQNEELNLSQNIKLSNCKGKSLKISKNITDNKVIRFEGNRIIKQIQFENFTGESEIFIDNNSKINDLNLINFNTSGIIDIRVEKLQSLKIINSHFESRKINFFNINIEGTTDILDSDLGETKFNGVIFNSLKFRNSSMIDTVFNGCSFPVFLEDFSNESKQKDNYRQLKHIMDKNGNHTEANKFFAKEMELYMKSLKIDSDSTGLKLLSELYKEGFDGEKTKKSSEKIPLVFSYLLNDFGNNWILAFQWLITLVLFSTLIDAGSTLFGIKEYWGIADFLGTSNDFIGDLIFSILIILGILLIFKMEQKKEIKVSFLDNFFSKFGNTIIFFFIVFLLITVSSGDRIDSFKTFGNLLNPLYFLENGRSYNSIEIIGFTIYKSLYAIILWHLIVAAKRTTKR